MAHGLKRGRKLAAAIILVGVLPLIAGCGEKNTYVAPPPPKVTVATPVKKPVTRYLESTGNVAAVNSADLVARVAGFVQDIKYEDGATVKKGQVLFVIEQRPYELKVQQAKANEDNAKAALISAQANYQRQADLVPSGSASKAALDNAIASRDSAQASVDQAIASTKLAENDLAYTQVSAPFDGIVTARKVSIGAFVSGNGTALASIVSSDPIYVNFTIGEQETIRVRAMIAERGLTPAELKKVPVEVSLQTEAGYPHKGTLDYAAPSIDPSTGTLAGRAILDNPKYVLLPGLFVRVRIPLGPPKDELLVPDTALGTDQSGRYLLVIDKDNVVEQRRVTLGPLDGTLQVIDKGVGPDDRIIINGMLRAVPGQKVDPQTASAPPKSS
ncbi:efflux RND transporter periplasmic adaptor subunit [Undibacter mobilis]|uniref:Efflux RND transporter periplasmic adaptor subunit n=1 Tax=Undibacter mobilis TaxID=2292256 RepID=A0A371BAZ0_9BRAD|nr:efflux RND transporter periplasmic adaptor subunit [Undibacter mobilis]RDV04785.1 efflux RND transporter periplasmic adaptor subunit [Undibacter mobilis]